MTDLTPDLQFLVGEPLDAVSFVMDYVELHFNGSYLRFLTAPTIARGPKVVRFPEAGSRDALCALIGAEVRAISGTVGEELRVEFSDGTLVLAPLSYEAATRPEVLHFRNQATGETQWW